MERLTELKAQAYDLLSSIQQLQAKLQEVNQAIYEEQNMSMKGQVSPKK